MTGTAKSIAYFTIFLGVVIAVGAALALKNKVLEQVYLRKLQSTELAERKLAVEELGSLGSLNAIPERAIVIALMMSSDLKKFRNLVAIAARQAASGDIQGAFRTANSITDDDTRGRALCLIAAELAKAGQLEEALRIGRAADATSPPADSIRYLLDALTTSGRYGDALKIVNEIEQGEDIRYMFLFLIAKCQAEHGMADEAMMTAKDIQQSSRGLDYLAEIAVALARSGKIQQALRVTARIDQEVWRSRPLAVISAAEARNGDRLRSKSLLDRAIQASVSMRGVSRDFDYVRAEGLEEISIAHAELGEMHDALQAVRRITSNWRLAEALARLAKHQARAGNRSFVEKCFEEAIRAAMSIEIDDSRASAFGQIAAAQVATGDLGGGRTTLNRFNGASRYRILLEIIRTQIEIGDLDGSLETFAHLKESETLGLEEAAAMITKALTIRARGKEAVRFASQQDSPEVKIHALLGVEDGRSKQGALSAPIHKFW